MEQDGIQVQQLVCGEQTLIEGVAEVNLRTWGRPEAQEDVDRLAGSLAEELADMDASQGGLFVARTGPDVTGFCRVCVSRNKMSEWLILGLIVDPSQQRQGIASALVRACIDYATEHGAEIMRSEAHADNSASIAFHEAFGFRNLGTVTAPDGDIKIAFMLEVTA